jgi:UDP-N-acetylmuramoyl-tripeptide--D-alanyl-D-alanine ligase
MQAKIARIQQWQAKKYLSKNKPTIVVITGSVGKTSTTQAIAIVLSEKFIVRTTIANYNTEIGVPCSIFNQRLPESLKNPFAWVRIILKNQVKIIKKAPFDTLVLELGTDSQGDIENFSWLQPQIAVVTAVAPEHMEYFGTIENVAKEELAVAKFSEKTIINKNMVDSKYLQFVESDQIFNYSREDIAYLGINKKDLSVVADHSIDAITAGIAVGKSLGMEKNQLISGAKKVQPLNGRMKILKGIKNSTLIDDTYNSSPEAVVAALKHLYDQDAPQRIALLGNMNELGKYSESAHKSIGKLCDPNKLDAVITLGKDSNKYTAASAREKGCNVIETTSPYVAAEKIKSILKEGAFVLLKGSQNGVFAEETVKLLLENPDDEKNLVRQSKFWTKKKSSYFIDNMDVK